MVSSSHFKQLDIKDAQHIIRAFTYDSWIVPGLIPEVDANQIEEMNEDERQNLIDSVAKHGDILKFVPNENNKTEEK